jgi:starvation-inducible DNA-binding protein
MAGLGIHLTWQSPVTEVPMSNRLPILHAVNSDQLAQTRNPLPIQVRQASVESLNRVVVNLVDVALAAKHAHWNVRGPNFMSYHALFDKVFGELMDQIDAVGERATALGGIARGTVQTVAEGSELKPYPILAVAEQEHVEQIAIRLGQLGRDVRGAIQSAEKLGDLVTVDVLTDVAASMDSLLWLIESHAARS